MDLPLLAHSVMIERNQMKNRCWPLAVLTLVACTGDTSSLSLGKGGVSDEWDERRRRMNIVATGSPGGDEFELTITDLVHGLELGQQGGRTNLGLQTHCMDLLEAPGDDGVPAGCSGDYPADVLQPGSGGRCDQVACESHLRLCVAHTLMELADVPQFDREIGEFVIGPQDRSSQAGLHEAALDILRENVIVTSRTIGAAIFHAMGDPSTDCVPDDLEMGERGLDNPFVPDGPTNGQMLGHGFAESYYLMREAADKAIDDNIALGDAAYAEETSLTSAARVSTVAPVLSRGHAAHIAIGFDPLLDEPPSESLPSLESTPLFTRARSNSASFQTSLALLRKSAMAPSDVLDRSLSIDDLVTGQGMAPPSGALVDRLEERYGQDLPHDADDFYESTGTSRADMREARLTLIEELEGFDRDWEARLPEYPHVHGPSSFEWYAATASPPTTPEARWSALTLARSPSQLIDDHAVETTYGGMFIEPSYARRGVAQAVDFSISMALELLEHGNTVLPDETTKAFASIISESGERPARVEFLYQDETDLQFRVLGAELGKTIVVAGTAGAECAVKGTVEGQPCDLEDYIATSGETGFTNSEWMGFDGGVEFEVDSSRLPIAGAVETYHVLRLPDGVSAGRGVWEDLASVPIRRPPSGGWPPVAGAVPANPWAAARVKDALEPTPDEPTRSARNCAGIDLTTQRIPLENELSEDGSGHENSWRTYLNQAREAADRADRLGEQLISTGLRTDGRAEQALSGLAEACGTNIDLDWSRVNLDSDGDGVVDIHDGPCPCSDDRVCYAGYCVADPIEGLLESSSGLDDANLSRLRACLATPNIKPFVSLGSTEFCVWRSVANPTEVCEGGEDAHGQPCPFKLSASYATGVAHESCEDIPAGFLDDDSMIEIVSVEPLHLFESLGLGDSGEDREQRAAVCDALRRLRVPTDPQRGADAATVWDSGRFFDPEAVQSVARGINATWDFGAFAELSRGGERWEISLGSPQHGPSYGVWPCLSDDSPPVAPSSPYEEQCLRSNGQGFWCQDAFDCDVAANRFAFSERLLKAVIATKAIGGETLQGMRVPAWIYPTSGHNLSGCNWENRYHTRFDTLSSYALYGCSNIGEDGYGSRDLFIQFDPTGVADWGWSDTPSYTDEDGWLPALVTYENQADFEREALHSAPVLLGGWQGRPWVSYGGDIELSVANAILGGGDELADISARWQIEDSRVDSESDAYRYEGNDVYVSGDLEDDSKPYDVTLSSDLNRQNIRDAMELICEAPLGGGGVSSACGLPPVVNGIDDLPVLVTYLNCAGDVFEAQGERMVFAQVPSDVADALGEPAPFGSHPGAGGDYGKALSEVRFHLRGLPVLQNSVGNTLKQFATSIETLEAQLRALGLADELREVQLQTSVITEAASCAASVARAASAGAIAGQGGAAAVTCAAAAARIAGAFQTAALNSAIGDEETAALLSTAFGSFQSALGSVESSMLELRRSQETIEGGLITIENVRRRARSAVSRALFADSDASGAVFPVNTAMRREMNSLVDRYEASFRRAVRAAALARLALEQRLGVENLADLTSMAGDSGWTLVEDPATWADSVCTSTGVDYSELRDGRLPDDGFEDMFIGTYVDRLEDVVESYRLDMPFSDGADTAVVSMRDEIIGVRRETGCAEGQGERNLLVDSSAFDVRDPSEEEGWSLSGCDAVSVGSETEIVDCISLLPLQSNPVPFAAAGTTYGSPARRLLFGNYERAVAATGDPVDDSAASVRAETELVQPLHTLPGHTYRLSFFMRDAEIDEVTPTAMPIGPTAEELVALTDHLGIEIDGTYGTQSYADGWTRYWFFFDAETESGYTLGLNPKPPAMGEAYPADQMVDVAAFMLEDVTGDLPLGSFMVGDEAPGPFEHSGASYAVCQDFDGARFRSRHWNYRCENQCPVTGGACSSDALVRRCYWESKFSLRMPNEQTEWLAPAAGFARGNYNYRYDGIGVNFVGTGIRDCEGVPRGESCYANGSVPYSIHHHSGFMVRNHASEVVEVPLFDGRIEQARGLAAERYITNPMSSADSALIGSYMRREFQGRPVAGNYFMRVWDDPGVRFDRIEDVQLILDYRYWTRLD
jgi:hypothetical protein